MASRDDQLKLIPNILEGIRDFFAGMGSAAETGARMIPGGNSRPMEWIYNTVNRGYNGATDAVSRASERFLYTSGHQVSPERPGIIGNNIRNAGNFVSKTFSKGGDIMRHKRYGPWVLVGLLVAFGYAIKRAIGRKDKREEIKRIDEAAQITEMHKQAVAYEAKTKEILHGMGAGSHRSDYGYGPREGMGESHWRDQHPQQQTRVRQFAQTEGINH